MNQPIFSDTLDHLLSNVMPAAEEYMAAENNLSKAAASGDWTGEAKTAKRKAADLAVAIDGLTDRASFESKISLEKIRANISALCVWPGSQTIRREAFERVHGVANAYKHLVLDKPTHVINSFDDVLVVGLGYGLDGWGVGKFGGVEVLVKDKQEKSWKYLGDVPTVIGAWFSFLRDKGAALPNQIYKVGNIEVYPL